MAATEQLLNVTLPKEMVDAINAKVSSGEYASHSEVLQDGLRILLARDDAVDTWLTQQVAPAYDALKTDPSRASNIDSVRAKLAAAHLAGTQDR